MIEYPICIERDNYKGKNLKRKNKAMQKNAVVLALESKINELLAAQEQPIQRYLYHEVAFEAGLPYDVFLDNGIVIDGGSNGFTAIRKGLSLDEALEMRENNN